MDKLIFQDDANAAKVPSKQEGNRWKIMIVDDEKEVHSVTHFALRNYVFKGRKLEFISAYSGEEAKKLITEYPDIAVILLDVVMEEDDSGLRVVEHIRNDVKNKFVRIILRTGHPGQAPEDEVMFNYGINDYKEKTELTDRKFITTITSALRSYSDIVTIESFRESLRVSESKYRMLLESLPQRIFYKDKYLTYVSCNKNYARALNIKPDEIRGKTDYDFYPKALAEKYRTEDKRIIDFMSHACC